MSFAVTPIIFRELGQESYGLLTAGFAVVAALGIVDGAWLYSITHRMTEFSRANDVPGQDAVVRRWTRVTLLAALGSALLGTCLVALLGANSFSSNAAVSYLLGATILAVFVVGAAGNRLHQGLGDPAPSIRFYLIGLTVAPLLAGALCLWAEPGVVGVLAAMTLPPSLGGIICFVLVWRRVRSSGQGPSKVKPAKLNWLSPLAFQLATLGMLLLDPIWFSAVGLAAEAGELGLVARTIMPVLAIAGLVLTTQVSQAGASSPVEAQRAAWRLALVGAGAMLLAGALIVTLREPIFGFLSSSELIPSASLILAVWLIPLLRSLDGPLFPLGQGPLLLGLMGLAMLTKMALMLSFAEYYGAIAGPLSSVIAQAAFVTGPLIVAALARSRSQSGTNAS